jgi:hypothetical protein
MNKKIVKELSKDVNLMDKLASDLMSLDPIKNYGSWGISGIDPSYTKEEVAIQILLRRLEGSMQHISQVTENLKICSIQKT